MQAQNKSINSQRTPALVTQFKPEQTKLNKALTYSLSPMGRELVQTHTKTQSLLAALLNNQCFADAVMVLSYEMPHKKGIQWAFQCASQCACSSTDASDDTHLSAVQEWLNEPSEKNREQVLPMGIIARPSAATWLAMAAYWSNGSILGTAISTDSETITQSPEGLVSDSIYSSVMLSIQEGTQQTSYADTIAQGMEIFFQKASL